MDEEAFAFVVPIIARRERQGGALDAAAYEEPSGDEVSLELRHDDEVDIAKVEAEAPAV